MVDRPTAPVVEEAPHEEEVAQSARLEDLAQELAARHTVVYSPGQDTWLSAYLQQQEQLLRDAYNYYVELSEREHVVSYAAEWILDNFYMVRQALRQIGEDMPQGYYRQLPKLESGPLAGYPRVYDLARQIALANDYHLELDQLEYFTRAYQRVASLTMGELWALPTMLRLTLLESLAHALSVSTGLPEDETLQRLTPRALRMGGEVVETEEAGEAVVASAIPSLRLLATQDWKAFFERVSKVEAALQDDPAGYYPLMDFDTRDLYRKAVEALARATGRGEEAVAMEAVQLAYGGQGRTGKTGEHEGHIGYYLIDRGRSLLESRLDYRPPWHRRLRNWFRDRPTLLYLGPILSLTVLLMAFWLWYAAARGATIPQLVAVALLTLVPALTVTVSFINWIVTHTLPPRVLPKLDFSEGIPTGYRTIVVIPALLSNLQEVDSLLHQLEQHYLRNADPQLSFALLTDFVDGSQEELPEDRALVEGAVNGISTLNQKYHRADRPDPFYLFHRRRVWSPAEGIWMGWERKRGKLQEFNHLLRGDRDTSFMMEIGDRTLLGEMKYVITLDADTLLPRDTARQLVGCIAHPLNRAEFDPETGELVAGYSVLQPRTEIMPISANQSLFTRVFTGDMGIDLYTRAVSDVYQDLFGEGIYVGKGIYDVDAFERSLHGHVPEGALLSHDLFEGIFGRAALVTDIILYEDYPPHYLILARRSHRWVRGDWQLLPWLMARVPDAEGKKVRNRLSLINRWKIFDNLRRSIVAPALLLLFVAGWLWLPGSPWAWTLLGVLAPAVSSILGTVAGLVRGVTSGRWRSGLRAIEKGLVRWLLLLVLLPYETMLVLDAVGTTLYRLFISRKYLLQWTSVAHTVRLVGQELRADLSWRQMIASLLIAVGFGLLVLLVNPAAFPVAAPLLLAWLLAPQIAYWISRPVVRKRETLPPEARQTLRNLARRTWFFYEQYVGPEDHWLPPDHFQESPRGLVAHRTSPTNIGLMLASVLSAYDFGYIGPLGLALRIGDTFDGMDQLERHRGHLLNWYETHTLDALPPRYVSTVDSGNLAASLWVLAQGFRELPGRPVLRWQRWEGLLDTFQVLDEIIAPVENQDLADEVKAARTHLGKLQDWVRQAQDDRSTWIPLLTYLMEEGWPELEERITDLVSVSDHYLEPGLLGSLRQWAERIHRQLYAIRRELDMLQPWLLLLNQAPPLFTSGAAGPGTINAWQALHEVLPMAPLLADIPSTCATARDRLAALRRYLEAGRAPSDQAETALAWCDDLDDRLQQAERNAERLLADYRKLYDRAQSYVDGMQFGFLFDPHRQIFHIGYNVDLGRLDDNYYDLLASEARIASIVAIAKGDVAQSHWLHLGRPLTDIEGSRVLLSWSGTMFEYLMPNLFMHNFEGTLLSESDQAAVDYQLNYGKMRGVPWGISESGYYRFDAAMNYQYRAFGAPGLGFKRGLADDLVIAPYASLLALPFRPQAVMENLHRLIGLQMLGDYGLYEAIDFTGARLTLGQPYAIVRSYMAHHQGMILLAVVNYLQHDVMAHRFHTDPRVRSMELLLQEQIPREAPIEAPPHEEISDRRPAEPAVSTVPWHPPAVAPAPQVHYLSNGQYSVLISNTGAGYSTWKSAQLTRWRADTTAENWGTWIYVKDLDDGALWSVGTQPTRVIPESQDLSFYPHMVDFRQHHRDLFVGMEVAVVPDDDVELRRLTITNHRDTPRRLFVCSYGEVVLTGLDTDRRHPAFARMFIESEYDSELNALLFRRRPRSSEEHPIYLIHSLVTGDGNGITGAYESDRQQFLGRGGTIRAPAALARGNGLTGTIGATLDPVMALGEEIRLAPNGTVQLAYLTIAAGTRQKALALANRYQAWPMLERGFERARSRSELGMRRLAISSAELERIQRLFSTLIYPQPGLRPEAARLAANERGQPALWAYGISGDNPILLVRIEDEAQLAIVQELLQAHAYWRNRKLKIDLVILNRKASGYTQEVHGRLQRLLTLTKSDAWLNRRGGIFIVREDQMAPADRILLESAARAVLDGGKGTLAEQLEGLLAPPQRLPPLTASLPSSAEREGTPPVERPDNLLFDNGLGGFSPDGREYQIYLRPGQWTPAPWSNVVANERFGFLVTEAGGGYTWAANSGENRLSPWSNDPVRDEPGEALFLRDEESAEIWSPTPLPAGAGAPYLARHGTGYSRFEHNSHGLAQALRLFVATDDPVKIVHLRLENLWRRPRRLTATYYLPWVLGTFRDTAQQFVITDYDADYRAIFARNPYNVEFGERVAFLASSHEPHSLTTDRTEFLGRLGTLGRPAGLVQIGLSGTVRTGLDPCAALMMHIDLPPGASVEVYFVIGQGENREAAQRLAGKYLDPERVEQSWEAATDFWDRMLETVQVETPDSAMNLVLNRWLLYQDLSCRIWGRSAFYQSSGAYGFRDQLQDVMAALHADPTIARDHILRAARHQFEEGDVLHWWHPPSGRGVRTHITDDLLWLPFVTAEYVEATGDRSVLDEKVPFLRGELLKAGEESRYGHYDETDESYTIYEHCLRAIKKGTTEGPHRLPLMGGGDWNDGMDRVGIEGRGESIWLGWFLYATMTRFASIASLVGDDGEAERLRHRAQTLQAALDGDAWDGEWYLRAYYDDGTPLGSSQNRECKIDSIAQSWSLISGAGKARRTRRAMAAVAEMLVRREDRLLLLFTPPFDRTPHDPGYIKGYLPGIRENGGQYTHAAIWAVWAYTILGDGDFAEELFRLINPVYHTNTPEKVAQYRVEPYVVAADVYSVPPHVGRGGWTWYTGSSGWLYRLGIEAILGLRRKGERLVIDPCIPKEWSSYRLSYRYGDSRYDIEVQNPAGVNRGVTAVELDGESLPEKEIPLRADGDTHTVVVTLGDARDGAPRREEAEQI